VELVRRTVGPETSVKVIRTPALWEVVTDAGPIKNALLNLCISARDAIPGGGPLVIEIANRVLDDRIVIAAELAPGEYVSVTVIDDGVGTSPDVADSAFDPFFTTVPLAKGTGLGLAMI
jgi:signal transduction histidine kinase